MSFTGFGYIEFTRNVKKPHLLFSLGGVCLSRLFDNYYNLIIPRLAIMIRYRKSYLPVLFSMKLSKFLKPDADVLRRRRLSLIPSYKS
jgi:hypothetical protein